MTRQRVVGAIRYPVFLVVWTAGVVAATAQLQAIEASPATDVAGMTALPPATVELAPVPVLDDRAALRDAVAGMIRDTRVASGAWQPRRGRPAPAIRPDVALKPVEVPPAGTSGGTAEATATATVAVTRDQDPVRSSAPAWKTPAAPVPASAAPREIAGTDGLRREKAAARAALRGGRFAEAYALLRPAVAEAGWDAEFLGLLALAAVRVGSDGEALVLYRHLADLQPDRSRWRMGLALVQQRLGLESEGPAAAALADAQSAADDGGGGLG